MGRYSKQRNSYSYSRSKTNHDFKCFKCGGRHFSNECTTRCNCCGGSHYVTNCPRLGRGDGGGEEASKRQKKAGLEGMKVPELKAACKDRGLHVSGKKAELIARLDKYIKEQTAATNATVQQQSAAAAAAASQPDHVYHLFDVEDDSKDAAMVNAVTTFETSQASNVSVMSETKPAAVNMGIVTPQSSRLSQSTAPSSSSFSQTSQSSQTNKPELTQQQKERMRRSLDEARKRKMARLSSAYTKKSEGNNNNLSQSSTPIQNPYLQQKGCTDVAIKTVDCLPPLPPGVPPIREETRKRLSAQQLEVIMTARPPPAGEIVDDQTTQEVVDDKIATAKESTHYDLNTSSSSPCVNKNLFSTEKQPAKQPQHPMVRVNAAAGTGKTTTLLHLATRCIDLGHESLTYVTYNRAAAEDAQDRMEAVLDEEHERCVKASTLHSCAMRLLQIESVNGGGEEEGRKLLQQTEFQNFIKEHWGKAIGEYVQPAIKHLETLTHDNRSKLDGKVKLIYEKASFLLFKTFENFTRKKMTYEAFKDEKEWGRHYYPVVNKKSGVFQEEGQAAKLGFPPNIYSSESSYSFYANICVDIWAHVVKHGIRTFDIDMKRAQLKQLRIPCSVLLVDECQDLDECQVDLIHAQRQFGTHIFFVGDSAQCIYGFRGAKSSYVMKLTCIDTKLTQSWRFGPNIARVANLPLYAKEHSKQTTENSRSPRWIPYRVQGARREDQEGGDSVRGGLVKTKSLLEDWKQFKPLTLVGRTNGGLMVKAMDLLGLEELKNPGTVDGILGSCDVEYHQSDTEDGVSLGGCDVEYHQSDTEDKLTSAVVDATSKNLPKIHINGKGEMSGTKKWGKAIKQIRILYELFTNRDETDYLPMSLPATDFREFANEDPVTWVSFNEICRVKEIMTYDMAVGIITIYQQNTLEAISAFESKVMSSKVSETEADIILTTCHSAKGLEWDHVEICNDLLDLSLTSYKESLGSTIRHPSFLKVTPGQTKSETPLEISKGDTRSGWQFALSSFKDEDINCLYVALTRAKKTLCVPQSIKLFLQDFDRFHYLVGTFKIDASGECGRKVPLSSDASMILLEKTNEKLTKGQLWNLYYDLVDPLRKECDVQGESTILQSLFTDCVDESMAVELDTEVKAEGQPDIITSGNPSVADLFDC